MQTVTVTNPDGTTTEVTMVCVQDASGNVTRTAGGAVDARGCRFRDPAPPAATPFAGFGSPAGLLLLLLLLLGLWVAVF